MKKASLKNILLITFVVFISAALAALFHFGIIGSPSPLSHADFQSFHANLSSKYEGSLTTLSHQERTQFVRAAQAFIKSGHWANTSKAISYLEKAYLSKPASSDLLGELLLAYSKQPIDQENALKRLETLSRTFNDMYPGNRDGWETTARLKIKKHFFNEATVALERAKDIKSSSDLVVLEALLALEQFGSPRNNDKIADALEKVSSVLNLNPNHLEGLEVKGRILIALSRPYAAKQTFETRLKLAPGDPLAYYYMGIIQERAGFWNTAKTMFQKSLRSFPEHPLPRLRLADIYHYNDHNDKYAEAHYRNLMTRYREYLSKDTRIKAERSFTETLFERGKREEALRMIHSNHYMDIDPNLKQISLVKKLGFFPMNSDFPEHIYLRALFYLEDGHIDKANSLFKAYLAKDPSDYHAMVYTITTLIHLGQLPEATELANKLASDLEFIRPTDYWTPLDQEKPAINWRLTNKLLSKKLPESSRSTSMTIFLALVQNKIGQSIVARRRLRKAISDLPTIDLLWLHLGYMDYRSGAVGAARNSFKRALDLNPKNMHARFLLGKTHLEQNHKKLARQLFEEVRDDPNLGHKALYELGLMEVHQKDIFNAIGFFQKSLDKSEFYIPSWIELLKNGKATP
ncbi:MAG: tetratricopeptide repeat protein [Bdellovibrionales bacterium]|nr:tetratricopeptide repeat protein [Bdellovibrionales bacterium]